MAHLILLSVMAVLTSFVVFTAIPWMAKRFAVMRFHDMRDSLYALGRSVPGARDTQLYCGLEFMTTYGIAVLRDQSVKDGLLLLAATLPGPRQSQAPKMAETIKHELATVFAEQQAQRDLGRLLRELRVSAPSLIFWRVVWAHPAGFLAALVFALVKMPDLFRAALERPEPEQAVATMHAKIERIRGIRPVMQVA